MYLIAGLGNIGREYNLTRHNIGFESIDYIAEKYHIQIDKEKFKGKYGQGMIEGQKVILLKPSTYMNLSGECIQPFLHFFDIPSQQLIVIHDDVDFDAGMVKVRRQGSGGTHNGMKNIIQMIGTNDFPRVRIGIGIDRRMDLANYVLSRFASDEIPLMRESVIQTADIVKMIVAKGIDHAMNECNPKKIKNDGEDGGDDSAV